MKVICEKCGHEQETDAPRVMGAAGGKKSRRIITPEQQAKMQEARKRGKG